MSAESTAQNVNTAANDDDDENINFLKSLLGRILHVHITDGRMFVGQFKCTDNECNIILADAYEYRMPTQSAIAAAASQAEKSENKKVKADMTSRFMGLIVVPGKHITKIELEKRRAARS